MLTETLADKINAALAAGQTHSWGADHRGNGGFWIEVKGPAPCGGWYLSVWQGTRQRAKNSIVRIAVDGSWRCPRTLLPWRPPQLPAYDDICNCSHGSGNHYPETRGTCFNCDCPGFERLANR